MDSRQAQSLLPDYTAGCLCEADEVAVRKWIEECPECQKEWHAIQTTLLVVSTSTQPLPSAEESLLMWQRCADKIFEKREAERLARQNPSLWSWIQMQPRWGWAALGGAVAILGSVWLMAPTATTNDGAPVITTADAAGELRMFRQAPPAASGMVNHHAGTAMDPFTDHVGTTLVSASATTP